MSDNALPATDMKTLRCCDCGGYPIDEGACFVAVYLVRSGKPELNGICELCYLRRLQRRARMVNISSGPTWQIEIPEIGIHRDRRKDRRR